MILPSLTAIVDADVTAAHGWTVPEAARACLRRRRTPAPGAREAGAERRAAGWCDDDRGRRRFVRRDVVVNDRADVARMAEAAGVHVGQDDLTPGAARAVLGPTAIIGLSTHTREQVLRARAEPISYLAVGPVFGTRTKDTGYDAVGIELVRFARRR